MRQDALPAQADSTHSQDTASRAAAPPAALTFGAAELAWRPVVQRVGQQGRSVLRCAGRNNSWGAACGWRHASLYPASSPLA
jgi:hypothetical protein